jgi:uncharacterized heparinase superfamily protein
METHYKYHTFSWKPDVLGQRLANKIGLFEFFGSSADDTFRVELFASIAAQTRHLRRVINLEAEGLPRLLALKGLILANMALPDTAAESLNASLLHLEK